MTLKQFFQVAGGALVALLLYSSSLPAFVKWPLAIFSFLLGAALAFLPFEERPLEQWIVAFFRTIYSPTVFFWGEAKEKDAYFGAESAGQAAAQPPTASLQPAVVSQEVENMHASSSETKLEQAEQSFMSKIMTMSTQPVISVASDQRSVIGKPQLTVEEEVAAPQQKREVVVPQSAPVQIDRSESAAKQIYVDQNYQSEQVTPTVSSAPVGSTTQVQFSPEASPPSPPTKPNTITGQVMDSQGKIIEGAILEIRDSVGRPVRAIKSNKAGHFWIATALANGAYEIVVDKEGYEFDPVSFEASGAIIPPVAIKAKNTVHST